MVTRFGAIGEQNSSEVVEILQNLWLESNWSRNLKEIKSGKLIRFCRKFFVDPSRCSLLFNPVQDGLGGEGGQKAPPY